MFFDAPGDLIKTEVIEPLGLTVSRAAEIWKVRRATLSDHLLSNQFAQDVAGTQRDSSEIDVERYVPA